MYARPSNVTLQDCSNLLRCKSKSTSIAPFVSTACANWNKINTDHGVEGFAVVLVVGVAVVEIVVVRVVEVPFEVDEVCSVVVLVVFVDDVLPVCVELSVNVKVVLDTVVFHDEVTYCYLLKPESLDALPVERGVVTTGKDSLTGSFAADNCK